MNEHDRERLRAHGRAVLDAVLDAVDDGEIAITFGDFFGLNPKARTDAALEAFGRACDVGALLVENERPRTATNAPAKLRDLHIIVPGGGAGYYVLQNPDLYPSVTSALLAAAGANRDNRLNCTDWSVVGLEDAIREAMDDAAHGAMDEG